MSYHGRPPMVPNMAFLPPNMMPVMTMPPHVMGGGLPIRPFCPPGPPPRAPYNLPPPIILRASEGPPVTVFVGNISERVPDAMIRQILASCGMVLSWKRVSAFGFCEFGGPEAGLRAVRLLHDFEIDGKKLVAKVDAKTKVVLDEYKAEERKKLNLGADSSSQDDSRCESDYMDDEAKDDDKKALERIKILVVEYADEINNFEAIKEEEQNEKRKQCLEEADIEEGKRDLITREIGKFREIMKKQEELKEKEVSRRKKDEREREKDKRRSTSPRKVKEERKRRRSKSRSRDRERDREREQEREREREREKERERERERERARERERDRERERERERERDDTKKAPVRTSMDVLKEKELEEEAREKKEADKRARKKEAAYQERLRAWETRERRKTKEYDKEKEKDRCKEEEREKEAKKLKEFLEDYDDERDDSKYYKGRELQRRLAERVREADLDLKDRQKEIQELEDLRSKVFSSGSHPDPTEEFERLKKERDDLYKPKLLIDVNLEQSQQRERELERERERELERQKARERERIQKERYVVAQANRELAAVDAEPIDSDSSDGGHFASPVQEDVQSDSQDTVEQNIPLPEEDSLSSQHSMNMLLSPSNIKITTITANNKKKKLDVKDVFNNRDDEEDSNGATKKRKLIPLDYGESKHSKNQSHEQETHGSHHNSTTKDKSKNNDESSKSQEEKRRHIKSLIDKIPTEKNALFGFQLDWGAIDNGLMEKKIRPWINKKIIEYIGEPEPTLVDFICSKVLAGSSPQGIIDDVQMVLDEEAEVFVVKMWRLLIYEVEAKKLGLVK